MRRLALALLILTIAATLASGTRALAQRGQANLSWQQRFLGILPLVKPDPKDPVAVTVNGKPITAAEITDYANTEKRMINATSTEETKAVYRDAMENLINRQLLLQEAEKRKIAIPDAEVGQRAREFQVAGASGQSAPVSGAPDEILMTQVRGSMEIEKMLEDDFRANNVRPTDAQIKSYYEEHKDLFVKDPGEVQIAHLAVTLPPNPTDQQKKAASDKIVRLYKEAQKTKDFAAFAKANSEDAKSAAKGGDLGYFHPGQLPPVVDRMVFSTPVGHTTQIVESNMGFSFIKVTARRGETIAPLSEVRAKIAMVLLDYNEEAVLKTLLKKLAKSAKIDFKTMPGQPKPGQTVSQQPG
ncbi:MAG: peptidylprolyl isomerase [Candidatus Binatus sp.]|uniref:peptidylprolyl isomerase n=1 Tax=Candidatus Binatus sp. TaxID=2811406 RepID=UPI0027188E78|nr:peptidylprolyl isomerase [Candidatus Binatus sp.]MDO8433186.1 peptidylprolyl isomerase [Candidatus Binatus sp.]